METIIPRVAITGLVRNCSDSLQGMFDLSKRIGSELPGWTYLFLESDSDDNSRQLLNEFGAENANGLVVSYGKLAAVDSLRAHRLAYLRNENIRILKSNLLFADTDVVIIMDMDGVNDLLDVSRVRQLIMDDGKDWAGLFANQLDFFYDIWALRREGVCEFDCWEKVRTRPPDMAESSATKKYVGSLQTEIPTEAQRIEVESAFGGFGVYRMRYLSENAYAAYDEYEKHLISEHVAFHQAIRSNGGRLFIEPSLINCRAPAEHKVDMVRTDEAEQPERPANSDDPRRPVPFRVEKCDVDYSDGVKYLAAAMETSIREDVVPFASLTEGLMMQEIKQKGVKNALVTLASGTRFAVDARDRFGAMVSFGFLAEMSDFNLFCRLVEPGSIIIDVGSNFGLYTIEAARIAGANATVFAFEPVPEQFALLKKNVVMNGLSSIVEVSDCAVAETAGERMFHITESASFSGLVDTGRSKVINSPKVSCIALDDWPSLDNRPVQLMKIDVEGAELGVLKGAMGVIERSPDLIIQFEATRKNQTLESQLSLLDWLSCLVGKGYMVRNGCAAREPGGALHDADLIGRAMGGNLFLMRKGAAAERRFLSCVADEHRAALERAAQAPGDRDMIEYLVPMFHKKVSSHASLQHTHADLEKEHAELCLIRESTWWRLGQRFVFPMLNALKGRR